MKCDPELLCRLTYVHHEVVALIVTGAARRSRVDKPHPRCSARIVVGHFQTVYLSSHLGHAVFTRKFAGTLGDQPAESFSADGRVDQALDGILIAPPQPLVARLGIQQALTRSEERRVGKE